MWTYHPDLLAVPVPRYTSFPTAAEFAETDLSAPLAQAIESIDGEVSLYVHIPYCEAICWYCGCNTGAANRAERVARYLDALHREIALVAERLPSKARIGRIAFGGGSPNGIAPVDFVRLMDALLLHFAIPAKAAERPVLSIELDPRSLRREWAAVLGSIGFTRASLGVQTFSPQLQRAIGRIQPGELIEASCAMLRASGVTSINFDLMYGLPGQTMDDLEDSLARSVALGADRIALFGYAHVPHIVPRQRRIDGSALPDAAARFAMAAFGHEYLTGKGYIPVGFDHFARPGDALAQAALTGRLRRNFQGFTEDSAPVLIGLGASAISGFPDLLAQNDKNAGRYRALLAEDRLPATRGLLRSPQDRARGEVIEALLCQGRSAMPQAIAHEAAALLAPFLLAGVCEIDRGDLVIPPAGLPYARAIAACFDPYRRESARRFSSAV
ncbi:oxygen-independent coproporphyrinogen III oxidase [Novosphingobium sp. 9]|uniref:oxygen-independent coproporphyrinogen III oxidase n=1 Tax=Novosphingobium sp. 9 TaxID=2025349 RepID=UPI0021B603E7|nr:oxygen-independent coproporphyrinogen III oxidase [Novosphingobium sp. 9]